MEDLKCWQTLTLYHRNKNDKKKKKLRGGTKKKCFGGNRMPGATDLSGIWKRVLYISKPLESTLL